MYFGGDLSVHRTGVFHSKLYDSKADIYSFGMMLWEMWYGRQAFAEFKGQPICALFDIMDGDHRPKHVEGSKEPPARWKKIVAPVLGWKS